MSQLELWLLFSAGAMTLKALAMLSLDCPWKTTGFRATVLLFVCLSSWKMFAEAHLHSPSSYPDSLSTKDGIPAATWLLTLCSALVVGSTGVLPLLFIPKNSAYKNGFDPKTLNILLSFAVGGLLGDVFFHLLPEAHSQASEYDHSTVGLLVIAGLVSFLCAEKLMSFSESGDTSVIATEDGRTEDHLASAKAESNGGEVRRRTSRDTNGAIKGVAERPAEISTEPDSEQRISPAGYLNLLANVVDNFTHGLAVAASFLAGHRVGLLTTFAIIVHEVPHEIGDFAILLSSGFNRSRAAVAQLSTASGAVVGAAAGLLLQGVGNCVFWVLPFTAGGFLYIALVSVLPTLLNETNPRQSLWQGMALLAGIALMKVCTVLE